jgi:hypothetical protein
VKIAFPTNPDRINDIQGILVNRQSNLEEGILNYAAQATPALLLFLSEADRTVVGFALEGATENLKDLDVVPPKLRLAGVLRLIRGVRHLNQEELAKVTKIGVRTLQRAPKIDFSVVLKPNDFSRDDKSVGACVSDCSFSSNQVVADRPFLSLSFVKRILPGIARNFCEPQEP